jgi:PASTA domain
MTTEVAKPDTAQTSVVDLPGKEPASLLIFEGGYWFLYYYDGNYGGLLARNVTGSQNFAAMSVARIWIGDFTGSGHSEVLCYSTSPSPASWWLGSWSGTQFSWRLVSQTAGFGNTSSDPTWIGDFTGSGHSQVLFYSASSEGSWWLGSYSGNQLSWNLISKTADPSGTNFGNTSSDPTWIGDFTGSGHAQVLFYSASSEGSWWLGSYSGTGLSWELIQRTANPSGIDFGNTASDPTWIGDFTGSGHAQALFFSPGDGHWWLGSWTGSVLGWTLIAVPIPPSAPPPPTPTVVPMLIGLSMTQAVAAVQKANLTLGFVWNPTNQINDAYLQVTGQYPVAGAHVNAGSAVDLSVTSTVAPVSGVGQLELYNCNSDGGSVTVYVQDSAVGSWQEKGVLAAQFGSDGTCPASGSEPVTLTFQTGHSYQVAAVDPELAGCDGNPATVACQRFSAYVSGQTNGASVVATIT